MKIYADVTKYGGLDLFKGNINMNFIYLMQENAVQMNDGCCQQPH